MSSSSRNSSMSGVDDNYTTITKDVWKRASLPLVTTIELQLGTSTEDWPSLDETVHKVSNMSLNEENCDPAHRPPLSNRKPSIWIPLELSDLPPLMHRRGKRQPNTLLHIKIDNPVTHEKLNTTVNLNDTTNLKSESLILEDDSKSSSCMPLRSERAAARARAGRNRAKKGAKKRNRQYKNSMSPCSTIGSDYSDFSGLLTPVSLDDFIMPYIGGNELFVIPPVSLHDENILIGMLRSQIEYYFSEENLGRDFYLRRKMDSEGYLPIHLIASFQRVQRLTQDLEKVIQAVLSSPNLEVKDGCMRTVSDPLRWPICDNVPKSPVTLPPTTTFSLTVSCPL